MGHIRESVHIDAPIDQVWEIITKPERFAEWQVGVEEVKGDGPTDRVGARYSAVVKSMGRRLELNSEVTRVEKPRLIEQKATGPGGVDGTALITLEPAGRGADVPYTMDYALPGGFVGGIADKLFMERALDRDIRHGSENLKALCEAQAKVPA